MAKFLAGVMIVGLELKILSEGLVTSMSSRKAHIILFIIGVGNGMGPNWG